MCVDLTTFTSLNDVTQKGRFLSHPHLNGTPTPFSKLQYGYHSDQLLGGCQLFVTSFKMSHFCFKIPGIEESNFVKVDTSLDVEKAAQLYAQVKNLCTLVLFCG